MATTTDTGTETRVCALDTCGMAFVPKRKVHTYCSKRCKHRAANAKAKAEMLADPSDPRHGTRSGYIYGCRCDRCKGADAAYYAENRERITERAAERKAAYDARYYAANRDRIAERMAKYYQSPEGKAASRRGVSKRYQRKRNAPAYGPVPDVAGLAAERGHVCEWDGAPLDLADAHQDHAWPLSRGGELSYRNGTLLCSAHNLSKSNRVNTYAWPEAVRVRAEAEADRMAFTRMDRTWSWSWALTRRVPQTKSGKAVA